MNSVDFQGVIQLSAAKKRKEKKETERSRKRGKLYEIKKQNRA